MSDYVSPTAADGPGPDPGGPGGPGDFAVKADDLVTGYARALLQVARAEGVVDQVEDELYRIARTFEANPELAQRLTDTALDTGAKLSVVDGLLSGRAHTQTVSAVMYVVEAGRARQLPQILDTFVALSAESRREAVAEVRTAVALDDAQQQRLVAAVEHATGRKVTLKTSIDPDVVGGVVVRVGDTVIDGSIARRLAELRSRMTGA